MGKPSSGEIPVQLMSSTSSELGGEESSSYRFNDVSGQPVILTAKYSEDYPIGVPLPHSVVLPIGNVDDIKEVPKSQSDILCYNSKIATDCNATGSSLDRNASKAKSPVYMFNDNNHETPVDPSRVLCSNQNNISDGKNCNASLIRYLRPCIEGEPEKNFTSTETQISVQNHACRVQKSHEEYCNVSQPHPTVTIAVSGFPSRRCNRELRQRASVTDRLRRARISERLDALRELLPYSEEGSRASLLDDVIDHVKYLQLQIKGLSQSRLGGEATNDPFIHLEGYGHYLLHQHMLNEPLEEMIGKLMEVNPGVATQLLESKGLSVMPMISAAGLSQTTEVWLAHLC